METLLITHRGCINMTTIVLGLDGANWELLDPWLESGKLPNIQQVREQGTWGDLRSCLPPVTSPNWKCYSTGKNPGKLGVYWWEIVDTEAREIRSPSASDYRSAELWDYLNQSGRQTAVINMPTTYPPRESAEWLIAGGPDAESTGYTTPADLEETLSSTFGYRVHPERSIHNSENVDQDTIEGHLAAIESRFDIAEWILEQESPDFLHITTFYINVLQHYYWNGHPTRRAWELIDGRIGALLDKADKLLLMSDHGSTAIEWECNLNKWLEEEGYLVLEDTVSNAMGRMGLTRGRLLAVLDALSLRDVALKYAPESLKKQVPDADGMFRKSMKNDRIDWEASRAVASGQGPVYVLEKEGRGKLTTELKEKLQNLKDPDGERVFAAVYDGSELYHGPYTSLAPALVADQNPGYHVPGSLGGNSVFSRPKKWAGENKRTGLFAFWGDGIAAAGRGEQFDIIDLMPTTLHWMGEGVPTDVDGDVRHSVFETDSDPATSSIDSVPPLSTAKASVEARENTAEDRLQDLGYL